MHRWEKRFSGHKRIMSGDFLAKLKTGENQYRVDVNTNAKFGGNCRDSAQLEQQMAGRVRGGWLQFMSFLLID